ncbi:SCO family protein [Arcticibacter tournemirensis]|uniref:SCO family protein n=1 Tax=Arcticibacter tournemirensis TaxID=699437 RepID=A0A4V1KIX8_9SPHI|nr:SCO family protein [Arcticibacter tournemirensis]RXF72242.1 SCO family protein [Arcticibacter tournemirensis]
MKFYYLTAGVLFLFALAACNLKEEKKLPVLGNREAVEKTVDGKTVIDTIYQTIPSFSFINQDSAAITNKDFDGKIYVADFFFTTCPSICPVMHRNMLKVYDKFKDNPQVMIASHTIDYKHDTPAILKEYATKLGVSGKQWQFLRGSRDSVYTLAEKHYLVAVNEDKSAPGGYIHQGWFVLIDKEKRLRGAYDGTQPDQVEQMISDMETLLKEYQHDKK